MDNNILKLGCLLDHIHSINDILDKIDSDNLLTKPDIFFQYHFLNKALNDMKIVIEREI